MQAIRGDARLLVLQIYDEEELNAEVEASLSLSSSSFSPSSSGTQAQALHPAKINGRRPPGVSLDALLSRAKSAEDVYSVSKNVSFDDILTVVNALRTYRARLGLEGTCTVEHLVANLRHAAASGHPETIACNGNGDGNGNGHSSMAVDGSTPLGADTGQCEAEFDRIHLCLTKVCTYELVRRGVCNAHIYTKFLLFFSSPLTPPPPPPGPR